MFLLTLVLALALALALLVLLALLALLALPCQSSQTMFSSPAWCPWPLARCS